MSDMLTATAVQEVERLAMQAAGTLVRIEGREYSTTPLHDPRKPEPVPTGLKFHTLQSLVDYVAGEVDEGYVGPRRGFLHVADPETVNLNTGIFGEHNQRATVAYAGATVPTFRFGQWYDPESFVILLQTCFEPGHDRDAVGALVGNLSDEVVATLEDDGVTQRAKLRTGVVRVAEQEVVNPVVLQPFRSFGEIEQVSSPFILRLRGGGGGKPPQVALFECDGGRWRLEAVRRVQEWLLEYVGDQLPVYA